MEISLEIQNRLQAIAYEAPSGKTQQPANIGSQFTGPGRKPSRHQMLLYTSQQTQLNPQAVCSLLVFLLLILVTTLSQAHTIYVSSEKDNKIFVIDGESLKVIEEITVGERPRGMALSKDAKTLYICTSDADHIEVLDLETLKVTHTLPSGPDPELLVIGPEGKYLYAANEDDNMVTVVDLEKRVKVTEIQVGVEPEGMGVSPDGKWLVNTSETTNMAHFINLETLKVEDNVLVDQRPRVAQFTHDGKQVWVSSEIGGTVSVIDMENRKIIKKINFQIPGIHKEAIQPVGIKITKNGQQAFVALGPAARVAVIDTATLQVEKYFLVGQRVWNLAFSPDEKLVYTTNGVSNDVSVIDVDRLKVRKSIRVGRLPWGVVVRQ
jgi:PQQ-dependent catabolism-associated beta-propeller protein